MAIEDIEEKMKDVLHKDVLCTDMLDTLSEQVKTRLEAEREAPQASMEDQKLEEKIAAGDARMGVKKK